METLEIIRQAIEEESMSCARVYEWHARFKADGKGEAGEKSKSMLIIFFDIKVIVHRIRPCKPNSQFRILL
jgi:hypothetical protein